MKGVNHMVSTAVRAPRKPALQQLLKRLKHCGSLYLFLLPLAYIFVYRETAGSPRYFVRITNGMEPDAYFKLRLNTGVYLQKNYNKFIISDRSYNGCGRFIGRFLWTHQRT